MLRVVIFFVVRRRALLTVYILHNKVLDVW